MDYLQKSILKTLAYWDVLDWPLTSFEIWRYLVNPRRLGLHAPDHYTLGQIREALASKPLATYVAETSGFWHLADRDPAIAEQRIDRELLADQKWKILKRRAKWFQMIPYVRLILGSGSMAAGNVSAESDWDLLVVTSPHRIWTTRLLLTLFADILGWRRKDERHTKNRFCLNHYVTEHSLLINLPSLYNAQVYARLIPICGEWSLYRSFQERNAWIRSYVAHYPMAFIPHAKSIQPSPILQAIRRAGERALDTRFGDRLEQKLGALQVEKIARNPKTGAPGGRVSYSDAALEFHPDSKEKIILARLNERLTALGFPELADERDSGLT
jgi:hypothetical protein